ncbi:hypothetical protein KP001_16330 [Geomonas subterranea]|uniref:Uncharacterized protein n=1 Tax=Geomonas subterranea TaxID=2847989 RepID=A0ABX8LD59_9BACT|nr:hypothetical protein [Geomonas subterranea]QXE89973.1 hypothetical protein KP001_16330 [Geomonas subterranea]QXM07907.1 hypothetical protein KP002_12950 [Geomonas subterranea]
MIKKIQVWDHSVQQVSTELVRASSIVSRFASKANGAGDQLSPKSPETDVTEIVDFLYECGEVLSLLSESLRTLDEDVVYPMLTEAKA